MNDNHQRDEGTTSGEITRPRVQALDEILGSRLTVLDQGFVRVIDYMGDDSAVVQAARVSYGAGTKRIREDRALIRYLMRHWHTTPFEMCEIKLHVRVPMDVWRQWIRHRTASVNEYSTRYSVAIDAAQRTSPDAWRTQTAENRQGSATCLPEEIGTPLSAAEGRLQELARATYEDRLQAGVAREQARKDLPLSTYTEAYWKIDLYNLMHFLRLRMDLHAQQEIRAYATVIAEEIMRRWVPIVWEAFQDYQRGAVHLSSAETEVIAAVAAGRHDQAVDLLRHHGLWQVSTDGTLVLTREGRELTAKLRRLGLELPSTKPPK